MAFGQCYWNRILLDLGRIGCWGCRDWNNEDFDVTFVASSKDETAAVMGELDFLISEVPLHGRELTVIRSGDLSHELLTTNRTFFRRS